MRCWRCSGASERWSCLLYTSDAADEERLGELLAPFLRATGCDPSDGPAPSQVAALYRERAATLAEMAESAHYLYHTPEVPEPLRAQHLSAAGLAVLQALRPRLAAIDWGKEAIGATLKAFAAEQGVKLPQVMMPLRVALSGSASTPAVDAVLAVLGRERTLERLAAIA